MGQRICRETQHSDEQRYVHLPHVDHIEISALQIRNTEKRKSYMRRGVGHRKNTHRTKLIWLLPV